MTSEPELTPAAAPLAQPFPKPGRLVELAYWELALAADGTPEQKAQLGDLRTLPRPWDPPTCTHHDLRLEVWIWLDDVVIWLNHEYVWDTAAYIPSCWPEHPHLVHDIAVLADQRRRAGRAATSDALEDWHRHALPTFLDRMNARLKSHCENGHQTSPSTSRHARHTSDPHRRRRTATFDADAALVRASQTELRPRPEPGPGLRLVDEELVDPGTGEVFE
ncbi:hypothetical protein [Phycicoccus sonneratiae]|uniref:Uncharacterized protein n=1 Tax=Phycicoccus sonneratiae TaxID=2807628 RepID=A0ABS2CRX6_9MICO|nr:hypothetical protein [Phycicoccus sonneraticus]MBM6402618.1 hypothetical protein [Phycicoccus sonneraticus]